MEHSTFGLLTSKVNTSTVIGCGEQTQSNWIEEHWEARMSESQDFLQRLTAILDEAKTAHRYGSLEIELRDGVPVTIREVRTHKIADAGEINRAKQQRRY
jgi:hypothetical protein